MARKVLTPIKLQVPGGQANPAPPVGPALGQHGVNIMEFCKQFNARTQDKIGFTVPVEITVFADRSFTFITKTPPAAVLLKRAAGIDKGSGEPNRTKVGTITVRGNEAVDASTIGHSILLETGKTTAHGREVTLRDVLVRGEAEHSGAEPASIH